jgi:hypothetical protein
MSAPQVFVGIDVAKAQLDIALRPTGERPADAGMQRAVWAARGGETRRSNAPGMRGTLPPPHGANTARFSGRETSRRGPGQGTQPDVCDPTEKRDA